MSRKTGSYLWPRCYECGHRLYLASNVCPKCGTVFDGRKPPRKWPEHCYCDRCLLEYQREKANIRVLKIKSCSACFARPPIGGIWEDAEHLLVSPMARCTFKKNHKGDHSWEPKS